ncbi:RND family efflux transporter MFP subunit [Thermincola ferriacetica]|uniref:RND family efflux transporter MFP subunit n=1 Tax=Thermincola ferriacetica TaxID=281456 RepID=A0A0L6W3A6_9FIRM|nr:efflux RND transporter periplasmic adaptor subunit [Thermincola ferriacetica]KNZ70062.1 RND family efflux transporter MFP subunit [Thermincola ferriacetica]
MRRLKRTLILFMLLLFAVLAGGCGNKETAANDEQKPVPVSVVKVEKGSVTNNTVITGKVTASAEVMIIPKIAGKVTRVTVDVGSKVKRGDLLVQLDTTELNAQLKQAQAALELAKGNAVQNDYRIQDAWNNLKRMENLYKEGAISKQQYELALLQYNLSLNTPTEAQVKQAQANVDLIKAQLANARITAPINGEISVKNVEIGELVGPSAPVLTIVDTGNVYVEGVITEKDIPFVREGQKVKVEIDALGEKDIVGTIAALSPAADSRTKGYQVKVKIENADGKIKPGMFAEISITTQAREDVPLVPKEVLVARGDKKVVYVVRDGVAYEQDVTTGLEDEKNVEITKGLKEGEQVVILGQNSLTDKTRVVIKE